MQQREHSQAPAQNSQSKCPPPKHASVEKTHIQMGYLPLLDSIALLWADHRGYFKAQGLDVTLVKEASWSSLRDRLAYGFLDAAHCLSAMLPAAAAGHDQLGIALQTGLILSHNQAYISLSQAHCHRFKISSNDRPQQSASKILNAMQHGQSFHFAHVFEHSIHHYCLRHWLALADPQQAKAIKLLTSPPALMVDGMARQVFDGFCVGEPWNIQSQLQGYSHVIAASRDIMPQVADKVLAVTQSWAESHPLSLAAISTAIQQAQHELNQLSDLSEVWDLLKRSHIVRFECSSQIHVQHFHHLEQIIRNMVSDCTPKLDDFIWLIQQMQRWDDLCLTADQVNRMAAACIVKIPTSETA